MEKLKWVRINFSKFYEKQFKDNNLIYRAKMFQGANPSGQAPPTPQVGGQAGAL